MRPEQENASFRWMQHKLFIVSVPPEQTAFSKQKRSGGSWRDEAAEWAGPAGWWWFVEPGTPAGTLGRRHAVRKPPDPCPQLTLVGPAPFWSGVSDLPPTQCSQWLLEPPPLQGLSGFQREP